MKIVLLRIGNPIRVGTFYFLEFQNWPLFNTSRYCNCCW